MNQKLLFYCLCLYIITWPFYIFDSGLPQPSDLIIAFGVLISLRLIFLPFINNLSPVRYLQIFIIIIFFINSFYSIYFLNEGISFDQTPFFFNLFYIFNYLIFIVTLFSALRLGFRFSNIFILISSISLLIQIVLIPFEKGNHEHGIRSVLFFNNPNQLAYYAVLILSFFVIVESKYRTNKLFVSFFIGATLTLTLISSSRIALPCIILLDLYLLLLNGLKINFTTFAFFLLSSLSVYYFSQNYDQFESFNTKLEFILNRIDDGNKEVNNTFFQERGYDRMYLYPEYNFFGAGEGSNFRWKNAAHQLELHSFWGTLLFCYGILGFASFMLFFYSIIKYDLFKNLLLIAPVILFNFIHQGGRDSSLWVLFAIILAQGINKRLSPKNTSKNNVFSKV